MGSYLIAGLTVKINNRYEYITKQCASYECTQTDADITVSVADEDIKCESTSSGIGYRAGYLESICAYRKICLELPRFNAMLLHAATVAVQNHGVAFLARSGVGKSTHMLLWKKLLGERLTVINGDKPIVRFFDGVPYVYGTPWAGKENLQTNARARLTDLCFIERSEKNYVERLSAEECVKRIMPQILRPSASDNLARTLEMTDKLLGGCNLWLIHCNMDISAAETACAAIIGEDFLNEA